MVLFEGPSQIDGSPIVAIATFGSKNSKTGNMIQTWILRSDIDPIEAVRSEKDDAICGACPFRGSFAARTCYVNVGQAPLSVWRAYKRGSYGWLDISDPWLHKFSGKMLRLGSYGDPVAVPAEVWRPLIEVSKGHTGYTHSWRLPVAANFKPWLMASTETLSGYRQAKADGWRSFRVVAGERSLQDTEILCPSDRVTCAQCRLCNGAGEAKDIGIIVHGPGAKNLLPA